MKIEDDALVIIPLYNEEELIFDVLNNINKVFKNILCINDGSTDKTLSILDSFKSISVISHCLNCGQGTTLLTGIKYFLNKTNFKYCITIDGDGQHSLEDAKNMLLHSKKHNLDAVLGSRFIDKKYAKQIPIKRIILLKIAMLFEKLFYKIQLSDAHNGLRVLKRSACLKLQDLECAEMAHATEIAFKLQNSNLKIGEYPSRVFYSKNLKGSQTSLNSLNIISELIQRK